MRYHKVITMEIPRTTFQAKMPVEAGGRAMIITKPEAKAARQHILRNLQKSAPKNILKGPYIIILKFFFKAPKSRIKKIQNPSPMIVKPDIDNLQKWFLDCLVDARWIENDQQVYDIKATKHEVTIQDHVSITII